MRLSVINLASCHSNWRRCELEGAPCVMTPTKRDLFENFEFCGSPNKESFSLNF